MHFDRWWILPSRIKPPTVRYIDQTRNVLVRKFVCRGTAKKIDQLIDSKRQLSQDLLEGGARCY